MFRNWLVVGVRVVLIGLILSACLGEGLARGRGGHKKSAGSSAAYRQKAIAMLQAQIAQAQAVLAQTEGSMSKEDLEAAQKKLEDSKAAIEAADSEQDTLRKQLRDIEEELISSQPADSEVGRARDAYAKAKEDADHQLKGIVESPDYVARLKRISDSSDAGKLRILIRKEALQNDQDYQAALHTLEDARKRFNQLKTELFAKDSDWTAASKSLAESEAKEKEARKETGGKGLSASKGRKARTAKQMAEAAHATIAMAEAKLKMLGVNPNGKGK